MRIYIMWMYILYTYTYIYIHTNVNRCSHTVYTHFTAGCQLSTWPIQSPGSSSGKLTGWWYHSSRICSEASVQLPCLPPDFMQLLQRESVESNGLKVSEWEATAIFTSQSVQWQGTGQFHGIFDSTARHDVHSLAWSMAQGRGTIRNSQGTSLSSRFAHFAQRLFESS